MEEAGTAGGWKVHLAQDNKAGLQRPSRTFSYSYTARQSYTTLSYLFILLTSYSYNISYYFCNYSTDPLMVWLPGFNEIKRVNKKLIRY